MAENNTSASFTIHLEDEISASANASADALQHLRDQIDKDTRAMDNMQKAMRRLKAGGLSDTPQYKALSNAVKDQKQKIGEVQTEYLRMGGGLSNLTKKSGDFRDGLTGLEKKLSGLPGPLGQVGQWVGKLGKLLSGTRGMALLAGAAFLVMAGAVLYAVAALTKYAIATADARRNELLRIEGLTKLRTFATMQLGLKPGNASAMQKDIDQVSQSVALGRDELGKYQDQLYRMGLRDENLTQALEGVAIKAAVQGDAAAQAFAEWAAGANMSGRSVKALADDVKARLGGIAMRQMLSLEVQSKKLGEAWDALFADVQIEGFLKGVQSIYHLFSQTTESGKALKSIMEKIVQPMIDQVTALAPLVKRFFQGVILAALDVGIAFYEIRNALRRTFGDSKVGKWLNDVSGGMSGLELACKAGEIAVYALLVAFTALGVYLAVLAAPFAVPILIGAAALWGLYEIVKACWAPMKKLGVLLAETDWGVLWEQLFSPLTDFGRKLADMGLEGLGGQIVDGLITGIKNMSGAFVDALKGLAGKGWSGFKDALGIHSPSTVFAALGKQIPAGVTMGVQSGTSDAQAAVDGMIKPPSGAAGGGAAATAAAAAPSLTVTIESITVNAQSGQQAKGIAQDIRGALAQELEVLLLQLGGAMPG